jgi:type IV pilus assembly protein PilE
MKCATSHPASNSRSQRLQAGFTIIELMIVVAIIGLLAGIGVPSYREYVNKSKRAEGKAALTAAAARLERYYSLNNCYPSSACGSPAATDSSTALTAAGIQGFSGESSTKAYYNISLTFAAQTFTITATPRSPHTDATCGNLTLSNTGRKWTQSNGTTDDVSRKDGCW